MTYGYFNPLPREDGDESGADDYASNCEGYFSRKVSLLPQNYTSRWSLKYLVILSVRGLPCLAELYNKTENMCCQISQIVPPGHLQTDYKDMAYTHQTSLQ